MTQAKFEVYPVRRGVATGSNQDPVWLAAEMERVKAEPPQWYWRLVAANGEIVANGEAYVSRAHAIRAVAAITQIARDADIVTVE